jgi:DNA-binding MarR family transcriptional regulator
MPRSHAHPVELRTPLARLAEAGLHEIVGYQLAQATIVTTEVFGAMVGGPLALRPVEFTILTLVHENPGVPARQLARALAVTPPNITIWLDRLEARGLVTRERSTADARMQHLRASEAGAALAQESLRRLIDGEKAALAALSAAERAMLVELLHKVALARKRTGAKA